MSGFLCLYLAVINNLEALFAFQDTVIFFVAAAASATVKESKTVFLQAPCKTENVNTTFRHDSKKERKNPSFYNTLILLRGHPQTTLEIFAVLPPPKMLNFTFVF